MMIKLRDFNNSNKIVDKSKECHFTSLLKSKWDEVHEEKDVFRYKINSLQEKHIGEYFLTLNTDRGVQRREPERIDRVCQPFDHSRFNFTQASPKEVLFNIVEDGDESDIHSVLVNVSPINQYHSLLCPSVRRCRPQVATEQSIRLALEIMFTAQDRELRIAFNSLCALASVNHLHYHLFILNNTLPVETAECEHLKGHVHRLTNYPVPAFCFNVPHKRYIGDVSRDANKIIEHLVEKSIAHNLLISRGNAGVGEGVRLILWPRKSSAGVKLANSFNIAVCELGGWFPITDEQLFNTITKEDIENELKKWKCDDFETLCEEVKLLL